MISTRPWLTVALLLQAQALQVLCLSTPGDSASSALPNLFDRFRVVCPAAAPSITAYDGILMDNADDDEMNKSIWAAVYRSNNNQPSVFVRDEFLQSMRLAVDSATTNAVDSVINAGDDQQATMIETPMSQQKPVAIACLRPSQENDDCWVLLHMRCDLKKENTDDACDGGSEHTEAVAAAIDALLLHYLQTGRDDDRAVRFERAIQAKGTLVSGILLEDRGFVPVTALSRDMTTHTSSLDASLEKYADRAVHTKSPGARERALQILSHLGRLNRDDDMRAAQQHIEDNEENDESDSDYDPWASVKSLL